MKKIILSILIILVVTIIGGLAYFYSAFNNFAPKDTFEISQEHSIYFNDSYTEARAEFRKASEKIKYVFPETKTFSINVPSQIDNDLTIDFCFIPGTVDTSKIIIISSGVHGVEGYVGSAVQLNIMSKFIKAELLEKTSILFIHSVNPYGFKYARRVTENNVDLNRNSEIDDKLYATINKGYPEVYDLINKKGKVNTNSMANKFFFIKAINAIRKATMPVLRQAILQGQYQFPEGLYFGGKKAEPQIESLVPIIDSICNPYQTIFAIDLHTGFGARGQLHLFPNPVESAMKTRMETLFDGYHIDWGDSDEFYTVTGDFVNYLGKINPEKTFIPMTFEYGTMNSQTTMGSLKSMHIMILENQGEQFGFETNSDSTKVKTDLLEMYNPSSESWKTQILSTTNDLLEKVFLRFSETEF